MRICRLLCAALPVLVGSTVTPQAAHAQAAAAQQAATQLPSPDTRIPLDPAVTTGTLPNGLTYYIRRNTKPEQRVLMQLAVKAGSIDEADDQQGLAHFLEHMAFNGTQHFKAGDLIATLESTGARHGSARQRVHLASTRRCTCSSSRPTAKASSRKACRVSPTSRGGMLLTPAEIDKERGVVIEEWRGGLGAGSRLRDQQIPVLYHESKYAERLPIGKPDILKSFTPERLRAFYTKWYRPDRMALVVVGDFEPSKMDAMVTAQFGPLVKPATPAPERAYPVPLPAEVLYKIATDPEATQSSLSIVLKRPQEPQDRVSDYRRGLVQQLVFQMLNDRFDEISRKADAPFLSAGAYGGSLSPTVETFSVGAGVQDGKIEAGLAAIAIEIKRVRELGFGAAELERARKWTLASYDRAYTERDKTESGSYVQEYINNFLEGEPTPGHRLRARPRGDDDSVDCRSGCQCRGGLDCSRRRAASSWPFPRRKPGVTVPTEAAVAGGARGDRLGRCHAVDRYVDEHDAHGAPARRGRLASRREIPELGVTIVTFRTASRRGSSRPTSRTTRCCSRWPARRHVARADPDDYFEAQLATALVGLSGVGGHSAVDLQKLLAGKIASAVRS